MRDERAVDLEGSNQELEVWALLDHTRRDGRRKRTDSRAWIEQPERPALR